MSKQPLEEILEKHRPSREKMLRALTFVRDSFMSETSESYHWMDLYYRVFIAAEPQDKEAAYAFANKALLDYTAGNPEVRAHVSDILGQ